MKRMREWMEAPQDKRSAPRTPGDGLVAYYWTGGAPKPRQVANVSMDGAYIQAADTWYPGTVITLTLQPGSRPESNGHTNGNGSSNGDAASLPYSVRAVVIRTELEGFGVHFLFRDRHERMGFEHFLRDARPNSSLKVLAAGQGGQALIEFALLLPVLFLLIMNVVNFGAFFFAWITVANAARAGSDYMIMGGAAIGGADPTGAQIRTLVVADALSLRNRASLTICTKLNNQGTITSSGTCTGIAAPPLDPESPTYASASVDVTYTFVPPVSAWNFPNLGIYLTLPSTQIHRRAVMRMEN